MMLDGNNIGTEGKNHHLLCDYRKINSLVPNCGSYPCYRTHFLVGRSLCFDFTESTSLIETHIFVHCIHCDSVCTVYVIFYRSWLMLNHELLLTKVTESYFLSFRADVGEKVWFCLILFRT